MRPGQRYRFETISVHSKYAAGYNGRTDVGVPGEWIWIEAVGYDQGSSSQPSMQISFDGGPPIPLRSGTIYPLSFEKVTFISNAGGSGIINTVTYLIGSGEPIKFPPRREQVTRFSCQSTVSCGAGVATQIYAAGDFIADRVLLCIPTGAVGGLYLSNLGLPTPHGLFLPVGYPFAIRPGNDGLYAINNNASAVVLTWVSEQLS